MQKVMNTPAPEWFGVSLDGMAQSVIWQGFLYISQVQVQMEFITLQPVTEENQASSIILPVEYIPRYVIQDQPIEQGFPAFYPVFFSTCPGIFSNSVGVLQLRHRENR